MLFSADFVFVGFIIDQRVFVCLFVCLFVFLCCFCACIAFWAGVVLRVLVLSGFVLAGNQKL